MKRHISLDFYNTLGIPNPAFAQARTEYLAEVLNVSEQTVKEKYSRMKKFFDNAAEEFGMSLPVERCWDLFLDQFGPTYIEHRHILFYVESLFMKYPPIILTQTISQIARLTKDGFTFSIGSNTNFICGARVRQVIHNYKLNLYGYAFSDARGYSKPSPYFFEIVKNLAPKGSEITHIGDCEATDGVGARKAGMDCVIINNAHELPSILANY